MWLNVKALFLLWNTNVTFLMNACSFPYYKSEWGNIQNDKKHHKGKKNSLYDAIFLK